MCSRQNLLLDMQLRYGRKKADIHTWVFISVSRIPINGKRCSNISGTGIFKRVGRLSSKKYGFIGENFSALSDYDRIDAQHSSHR